MAKGRPSNKAKLEQLEELVKESEIVLEEVKAKEEITFETVGTTVYVKAGDSINVIDVAKINSNEPKDDAIVTYVKDSGVKSRVKYRLIKGKGIPYEVV